MSTPWCSAAAVLDQVGRMLGKDPATLTRTANGRDWVGVAADALLLGHRDIAGVLGWLGYDAAQLDGWDHRAVTLKMQAALHALRIGGVAGDVDPDRLAMLDQIPVLKETLALLIGGVPTPPTPGLVGGIASGSVTAADTAVATRDTWDPDGYFR